jgi:hypothetical protein
MLWVSRPLALGTCHTENIDCAPLYTAMPLGVSVPTCHARCRLRVPLTQSLLSWPIGLLPMPDGLACEAAKRWPGCEALPTC